jgi:hypothetical protein
LALVPCTPKLLHPSLPTLKQLFNVDSLSNKLYLYANPFPQYYRIPNHHPLKLRSGAPGSTGRREFIAVFDKYYLVSVFKSISKCFPILQLKIDANPEIKYNQVS